MVISDQFSIRSDTPALFEWELFHFDSHVECLHDIDDSVILPGPWHLLQAIIPSLFFGWKFENLC